MTITDQSQHYNAPRHQNCCCGVTNYDYTPRQPCCSNIATPTYHQLISPHRTHQNREDVNHRMDTNSNIQNSHETTPPAILTSSKDVINNLKKHLLDASNQHQNIPNPYTLPVTVLPTG